MQYNYVFQYIALYSNAAIQLVNNNNKFQMFDIILIILDAILIYFHKLWALYFAFLAFSLVFTLFEVATLVSIKKDNNKFYKAVEQNIRSNSCTMCLGQNSKISNTIDYQEYDKVQSFLKFAVNKMSTIFGSFIQKFKVFKKGKKVNSQVYALNASSISISQVNQNQRNQILQQQPLAAKEDLPIKFEQNQSLKLTLQQLERERNLRQDCVNLLISILLKQLTLSHLYGLFVVFVISYQASLLTILLSVFRVQIKQSLALLQQLSAHMKNQNLIFLIPIMINTLWKARRIFSQFANWLQGGNNKKFRKMNEKQLQHLSLIKSILENMDSRSLARSPEIISVQPEDGLQIVITLVHLQCVSQILVCFYTFCYCSANIIYRGFKFFHILGFSLLFPSQQQPNLLGIAFTELKYTFNRIALFLLILGIIMLKYHYSQNKSIGTKQALWDLHIKIDKVIKAIGLTMMRKWYHKKIHKLKKNLQKKGLIDSKENGKFKSQKLHNLIDKNILNLQYYSSL